MINEKPSLIEQLYIKLLSALNNNKLPFISALIFGLAAHGYAFTNKFLNADETAALYSKGATITSGRWGLELTEHIFPSVSMPWIYGIISIVLLGVSACIIIKIFKINSKLLQFLLSGMIVAFPAVTGNMCFMFTSASYSLAILLAVVSVRLFTNKNKIYKLLAVLMLVLSMGIYQAYVDIAAGFFVLLLIRELMEKDSTAKKTLKDGLIYLAFLVVSLIIYYAITMIVNYTSQGEFQSYDVTASTGILSNLIRAYTSFAGIFISGYFGFVNSKVSLAAHLICLGIIAFGLISNIFKNRSISKTLLGIGLVILFPLSVNCMYLVASVEIIHSLVLFGFISFYVFAAIVADTLTGKELWGRDALSLALAVILFNNIFFSNKVYLKMNLEYENAFAFYSGLMAKVMDTPGFRYNTVIDLAGNAKDGFTVFDNIDTCNLTGPNEDLINSYTRVDFIKYYLGLDLFIYREDLMISDWFDDMPCYPDEGSIVMRESENRIIVKLGERDRRVVPNEKNGDLDR